ncbi:hypothetical protein B0H14DRAFT_2621987 [Mycena olivaceomarginata]|nr:hypothetical protein B0H14DRAFT_2621987 [Mycena olivaceomarginata]
MAKGILLTILQKKLATNRRKVQPARYQTELADKTQLEKIRAYFSSLQIEDGGDETRNTEGMRDSGVDRITRDAAATQVMQPRGNLWLGHSGCVEGDFERFEVKTMLGKRLEYSESDARGTMLNVSDESWHGIVGVEPTSTLIDTTRRSRKHNNGLSESPGCQGPLARLKKGSMEERIAGREEKHERSPKLGSRYPSGVGKQRRIDSSNIGDDGGAG